MRDCWLCEIIKSSEFPGNRCFRHTEEVVVMEVNPFPVTAKRLEILVEPAEMSFPLEE